KVKSDLDAFKTAVGGLKLDLDFSAAKATSTDTSLLTATATSTASAGSYDIKVSQLAQAGVKASAPKADPKVAVGTAGTFTMSVGSKSFDITLDGSESLEGIRDKINAATMTVDGKTSTQSLTTASVINTGTAALPQYKLVMSSTGKGTDNAVNIDSNLDTALGGFTETQEAKNAKFTINGLDVERSTNSITDVVDGVTLNLVNADTSKTLNLTVARDTDAITKKVNDFVSAYNKLASTVNSLHQKGGTLEADNSATAVLYQLQSVFNDPAKITGNDFNYLAQVGISFKKDGTLSLDSSAFTKALESNSDKAVSLFTDTDRGFARRLYDTASNMLNSDGLVDSRIKGLNSRIKTLDSSVDRENVRLNNVETRLRRQYANLDSLLGTMKNTASYLSSQLR
ncbi:MAG TPA: flagellar filament capping protein FliD, partial [Azospira sp.]|nr:flagellar filament capping protein FliD [Azospira sp.]